MKHIYKHGERFQISKKLNGEWKYFGTYQTLSEAQHYRDELVKANWEVKWETDNSLRYLYQNKYGKWEIRHNGYWGVYNSLCDAKAERDLLELYGWEIEDACAA